MRFSERGMCPPSGIRILPDVSLFWPLLVSYVRFQDSDSEEVVDADGMGDDGGVGLDDPPGRPPKKGTGKLPKVRLYSPTLQSQIRREDHLSCLLSSRVTPVSPIRAHLAPWNTDSVRFVPPDYPHPTRPSRSSVVPSLPSPLPCAMSSPSQTWKPS